MMNGGLTILPCWLVPVVMLRTDILCGQVAAFLDTCRFSHEVEQLQNWNVNKHRRNILWKTA